MGWAGKRRSATRPCDGPDRGLKPTATLTQSLRDPEGASPTARTATGPRSQWVERASIAEVCTDRRPGHALRAGTARAPQPFPPDRRAPDTRIKGNAEPFISTTNGHR